MTADDYDQWVSHHAALFWMNTAADDALFAAWRPLVMPYDLDDFIEGSNYLATDRAGAFRTEHLTIIRRRINERRMVAAQAQAMNDVEAAENYDCLLCRGFGVAVVPHPQYVRGGVWVPPQPEAGICCKCPRGRARFDSLWGNPDRDKTNTPLAFDTYEGLVPGWRDMLDEKRQARIDEVKARQVASYADKQTPLVRGAVNEAMAKVTK